MAIKTIDTSEAARYICREINRFKIVGPSTYQDLLDAAPAVEQEKPINQCDGCQAGMQCMDGLHYHNDKPVMACTKRLYIGKPAPVECVPVGVFMGKRETPENTTEFWGMLSSLNDIPTVGTKLYTAPPQGIDAETRRMVLELCDAACEHVKVWTYPYGTRTLELSNKIRERMGRK